MRQHLRFLETSSRFYGLDHCTLPCSPLWLITLGDRRANNLGCAILFDDPVTNFADYVVTNTVCNIVHKEAHQPLIHLKQKAYVGKEIGPRIAIEISETSKTP
jgi:hypothetical protein